jgi:iron complex outermembrane receptor protein
MPPENGAFLKRVALAAHQLRPGEIFVTKEGSNLATDTVLHPRISIQLRSAGRIIVKVGILSLVLAAAGAIAPVSAQAVAETYQLDIPRQQLDAALKDLAQQTGLQIARFSDTPGGSALVGPVSGNMPVTDALKTLLAPNKLTYKIVNDHTIAVVTLAAATTSTSIQPNSRPEGDAKQEEGKKSSSGGFRLAQANQGSNSSALPIGAQGDQSSRKPDEGKLTEIIVTAQKKTERLQDVPVPVTAISADTLLNQNLTRIQEYYTSVPGLNVVPADFRGDPILTIRGISTGGGGLVNPTVGVVIDDVPYGSSTGKGGGGAAIDLDPSDLSRVEVLRGPQGTLYGVSSIGGLLKYVTVDPSTAASSGQAQVGLSDVRGGELGYNARAAANIPLADTFAVRISGFFRQDPGYVDNVLSGQKDVNKVDVYGGHISALWQPMETFSLKLSAIFQEIKTDGSPNIDPSLGDLKQSAVVNTGWYNKKTQAYSAIAKAKLGTFDLTSLSGYSINQTNDAVDYSNVLGAFSKLIFGWPPTFVFTDNIKTSKFTQEFQLSTTLGSRFDWLLGAFYTHEKTAYLETDYSTDPVTGQLAGYWLTVDSYPTTYEEYAAFTDLTFHATDNFEVQFGGRESTNRQSYTELFVGVAAPIFFGHSSPLLQPLVHTKDNSFTYLVTPQFKMSDHMMIYARLASGYRAGGPNANAALYNLPLSFAPDTTRNYEIGVKGDVLNRALSFDASIYYIDWRNIQLQLTAPVTGANFYANGSRAKSQGVELSLESRPVDGLRVAAWVTYDDAKLTEPFPAGGVGSPTASSGDRLPGSSRYSGNVSLDEEFTLTERLRGFVGGSLSYVGDRKGIFMASPMRQDLPPYATTDLHAGVKQDSWTVNLFLINTFDRRGVLGGGLGTINPVHFNYIQPRTAGFSVMRVF